MTLDMTELVARAAIEAENAKRKAEMWYKVETVIGVVASVIGLALALCCIYWLVRMHVTAITVFFGL